MNDFFPLSQFSPLRAPHILICEDDPRLQRLISSFLERRGAWVSVAGTLGEASDLCELFTFDILLLDVMLPDGNGLDFLEKIRRGKTSAPAQMAVFMLSALSEVEHRLQGLRRGADDYLGKPFDPEELVLRLLNLWNRLSPSSLRIFEGKDIRFGPMTYDPEGGMLTSLEGHRQQLPTQERIVLNLLLTHEGESVSRETLQNAIGGEESGRTLDTYITRLRRKIEENPRHPQCILTIRGEGYKLLKSLPRVS